MNVPWNEDERLAALLDARLGDRERADMLAHLAADDDAYRVFVSLAAILCLAEGEDARADTSPDGVIALYSRPRMFARRWIAVAAVVTGVALAHNPALEACGSVYCDPVRMAALLESDSADLAWGERVSSPWSSSR